MEVYSEVTMAKDALKQKAVEIATPAEENGLELAKEVQAIWKVAARYARSPAVENGRSDRPSRISRWPSCPRSWRTWSAS